MAERHVFQSLYREAAMALPTESVTPDTADEEIIELTDIVEKGIAPDSEAAGSGPAESPEDGRIDPLIAGGEGAAAGAASERPAAREEMSDRELEALLADLAAAEAPASPAAPAGASSDSSPRAESPASVAPESDGGADDLDALLNSIMDPGSGKPPAPQGSDGNPDDDLPDLDSLLAGLDESITPSGDDPAASRPANSASPAPEPAAGETDDLDSLLDAIMSPGSGPQASSREANGDPDDDLPDIDSLLAGLDEPAAPAGKVSAPEGKGTPPPAAADLPEDDELEALLAGLGQKEGTGSVPPDAGSATDGEPEVSADLPDDGELDALLADSGQEAKADSAVSAAGPGTAGETSGGGADDGASAGGLPDDPAPLHSPADVDASLPMAEGARPVAETSATLSRGLEKLTRDIAILQAKVESFPEGGTAADVSASIEARLERLQAEVEDLAETHASGLAAAEARISALEAELAERDAVLTEAPTEGGSVSELADRLAALAERVESLESGCGGAVSASDPKQDDLDLATGLVALEDRLSALEAGVAARSGEASDDAVAGLAARVLALEVNVEKAASEAAARVIREEIAAMLAEMAADSDGEAV